jgi:uncharacterized LabA/DUF88 family protein
MIKVMLFIDGSWLYRNTPKLAKRYGRSDYRIDYGKLPAVLAEELAILMNLPATEIHLVRSNLFASIPVNYHADDEDLVEKQRDFYEILREEYHYETEIYDINFSGGPVKSQEDVVRVIRPEEKCVDVALASSLLSYAAIPGTYDIAMAVIGDRDYVPAFRHVRQLGKRVAIASIQGSCAKEYLDPADKERVRDFDVIFLGNYLNRFEFKYEPRQVRCESEFHIGNRTVWTTYRPRKGRPFFCDECMAKYTEQRKDTPRPVSTYRPAEVGAPAAQGQGPTQTGMIKRVLAEKFYGFIAGENNQDYYFNKNNLAEDLPWDRVQELGLKVDFEIYREPNDYQAGAAMNVRLAQKRVVAPFDVEDELAAMEAERKAREEAEAALSAQEAQDVLEARESAESGLDAD